MKSKNVFLCMCTFIAGAGGALGSMGISEEIYVKGQYGNLASPIECINTHRECSPSTEGICIIIVPLIGGGTQTASTNGVYKTYRAGCIWELGNPESLTQVAVIDALDGSPRRLVSGY